MALPSDRDGFLLGDPITIDRESFAKALGILRAIKGDTTHIRTIASEVEAIGRAVAATPARPRNAPVLTDRQARALGRLIADSAGGRRRATASARPRAANGRFLPSDQARGLPAAGLGSAREAAAATPAPAGAAAVPVPSGGSVPQVGDAPPPPAMASVATPGRAARSGAEGGAPAARMPSPVREVATPGRGSNGRFLSRAERDGGTAGDAHGKDGDSRLAGAAERLGDAVDSLRAAGDAAEAVDPTMTAVREVGEVVTPVLAPMGSLLKTGFGKLFGRGESEEVKQARPWYKRILKELVELRRSSGGGPAASSRPGMLMPLLTSVAGFATPMLMGLLGAAIPLLLAGAGALLAGGIGWKIGEWINEKWGQQISDAVWNTSEWIKEKWGGAADWFASTWESVTTTFDEVAGKFGAWLEGLADFGKGLVDKAVEAKDKAKAWVSEKAETATTWVGDKTEAAKTWVGDKVDAAKGLVGKGSEGNRKALIEEMTGAGVGDPREQAAFLAQMDHESGGFKRLSENLNYSAEGLLKTFPKYYKTLDQAKADARNPEAIANRVYGGRLGNTAAGDGYKYRGRGFVQLTGKANYAEASKALGIDLVNNPELAADPANAAKISTWFWKRSGAGAAAREGDLKASRKRINGGLNGMADVQKKYNGYLGALTAGTIDATGKPKKPVASTAAPLALSGEPAKASAPSTPAVPPSPAADGAAPAVVSAMPPKAQPAPLMMASAARPVSAAIPMPTLASMAPAPASAPAPAPAVQTPIGSNARTGSKTTVTLSAPITQNLSDRSIAHVATGGLGG